MKRLFCLTLALLLCCCLWACGDETVSEKPQSGGNAVTDPIGETTAPVDSGDEGTGENTEDQNISKNPVIAMSDNLQDFTVRIDGTVYQFPCSTEIFLNDGWQPAMTFVLEEDYLVEPGKTANTDVYRTNSSQSVFLLVYNPGKSACKFEECVVSGVYLPNSSKLDIEFSNGLKLGDSITVDDFLAANSDFRNEGAGSLVCSFKGNRYYFQIEDDILTYVQMETKKQK